MSVFPFVYVFCKFVQTKLQEIPSVLLSIQPLHYLNFSYPNEQKYADEKIKTNIIHELWAWPTFYSTKNKKNKILKISQFA